MRTLLTELDLQSLKWLLTPEIANIILGRALFASRVMLPIMKDAAKAEKTTAWLTTISEYEGQITKFAKEPALLANETLKRKDTELLGKLPELTKNLLEAVEVQLKLPQKVNENAEEALQLANVTAGDISDDEDGDEDVPEDRPHQEEEEEPLAISTASLATTTTSKEILDLSCPSSSQTKEPAPAEKALIHIADAAKAFLFHQEKHNRSWSGSANRERDLVATSKAVERMFSWAKEVLDANSQTRIAVLEPLVVLHDIPTAELVHMWARHNETQTLSVLARSTINSCPRTAEFDSVHLEKALAEAKSNESKWNELQQIKMINDFLISQTIVQPGERVLKRQLQEGLGDERTKRLKIAVGKEPTVALLRAEYFASPTPGIKPLLELPRQLQIGFE